MLLRGRHPSWLSQLQQRLRGSLGDLLLSRILFLPRMKNGLLMQHLAGATLMLDPFPFGGGVTSMEVRCLRSACAACAEAYGPCAEACVACVACVA